MDSHKLNKSHFIREFNEIPVNQKKTKFTSNELNLFMKIIFSFF